MYLINYIFVFKKNMIMCQQNIYFRIYDTNMILNSWKYSLTGCVLKT